MERENKLLLGTIYLFIVITSGVTLINKLCSAFLFKSLPNGLRNFIIFDIFWLAMVTAIVCILTLYFAKRNVSVKNDLLKDKAILLASGVLITIDGMIALSSIVPARIISIQSSITVSQHAENIASNFFYNNLISNIISIIVFVIQTVMGIILIKKSRKLGAY